MAKKTFNLSENGTETKSANVLEAITKSVNFNLVKTENVGEVAHPFIEVQLTRKDKEGHEVTVTRKCRDVVAVSALQNIGLFGELRSKSLKAIVLAMAKVTDEHAKAVDKHLKTAKALIKAAYPTYSDNTIGKYRRIGLLFSDNVADPTNFKYCSFIDEDVSISNLDVILTLFDGLDVEKASETERKAAVSDFYAKYIATDMIHLHKSQNDLKAEVKEILNPTITVEAKEVDEKKKSEDNSTKSEDNSTKSEDNSTNNDANIENVTEVEKAQYSIANLVAIFKGNAKAEEAIAILMEELTKMF